MSASATFLLGILPLIFVVGVLVLRADLKAQRSGCKARLEVPDLPNERDKAHARAARKARRDAMPQTDLTPTQRRKR